MTHEARAEQIINDIIKVGIPLDKIEDILVVNFREVEARAMEPLVNEIANLEDDVAMNKAGWAGCNTQRDKLVTGIEKLEAENAKLKAFLKELYDNYCRDVGEIPIHIYAKIQKALK